MRPIATVAILIATTFLLSAADQEVAKTRTRTWTIRSTPSSDTKTRNRTTFFSPNSRDRSTIPAVAKCSWTFVTSTWSQSRWTKRMW